ncbi:MAG: 30S ribosomal protein S27e [Candidatus Iainarchaeum archaeon]|uniref:Small ribosomal subunit protein eS27 n=1 Tax=Candidatus Iainarchaeum sp. TaxID=3101447 RepID=A0A497JGL8_9ARCH|nr:MAG: 30S ribosomal protein S27e [Candidatus Diapherotrites archaeon]
MQRDPIVEKILENSKPRSYFLKVKCEKCGNTQIIFSAPSRIVRCLSCNEILAYPTGSKAKLNVKKGVVLRSE